MSYDIDTSIRPILKLNELSVQERKQGLDDLHGVSDLKQEDPQLVQKCLLEMKEKLRSGSEGGGLYDENENDDDDGELIKFLRAENFNVEMATGRYIRYQERKMKLFGKRGEIEFSDLTDQDVKSLQSGFLQHLKGRDRSGRPILISISSMKHQIGVSVESEVRCLLFLASQAAKDEETQKRGLVLICYALAVKPIDSRLTRLAMVLQSFHDLPARVASSHLCIDNPEMQSVVNMISDMMESNTLCRFRSHYGTHMECQQSLMTFGIPKETLPIDFEGQVDLSNHRCFLRTLQSDEARPTQDESGGPSQDESGTFLIPGSLDIVMGRGQHAKNMPGHVHFTRILDKHREQYESVGKFQKAAVADLVLKKLQAEGCRFLKPRKEGGWEHASDDVSREKINHAFRNRRIVDRSKAANGMFSKKFMN
eukprot:scaffold3572_cov113-Cylindrotheca_fusiformis.AAC.4